MESKNKEKKTDQSKVKSKNLGRPKGQQDKKVNKFYNIKNMKKEFRTSAKSYKLNNKQELVYIRTYQEKDKLKKNNKKKSNCGCLLWLN